MPKQLSDAKVNEILDRVDEARKEIRKIERKLDKVTNMTLEDGDWMDKINPLEEELERRRYEIGKDLGKLANSRLIRTLEKLSDEYVSPEPALGYWISSWC